MSGLTRFTTMFVNRLLISEKSEVKRLKERLDSTQPKTVARFSRGNASIQSERYITEEQLIKARKKRMKKYA